MLDFPEEMLPFLVLIRKLLRNCGYLKQIVPFWLHFVLFVLVSACIGVVFIWIEQNTKDKCDFPVLFYYRLVTEKKHTHWQLLLFPHLAPAPHTRGSQILRAEMARVWWHRPELPLHCFSSPFPSPLPIASLLT